MAKEKLTKGLTHRMAFTFLEIFIFAGVLYLIDMKKILIYILISGVVVGCVWFFINNNNKEISDDRHLVPPTEPDKTNARFEWSYEAKGEKDGIPHTIVSLLARYTDGTTEKKQIDEIEGGCNEYVTPDKDVYSGSKMIICYYAGFGRYYKIVQSGVNYLVERKEFEEASPEYNPPIEDFQTIAQF